MSFQKKDHLEKRFTRVFETNSWLDEQSVSGPGSRSGSQPVTEAVAALDHAIADLGVRSIADVPCGDLNWMAPYLARHPSIDYKGYDIVRALIIRNAARFPALVCRHLDAVQNTFPAADLIFCKDLLIHLEYDDIRSLFRNFVSSGSRLVLATNNFGLGNSALMEDRHGDSACRYVDLLDEPFCFPPPLWRTDLFGLWDCEALAQHFDIATFAKATTDALS